MLNWIKPQHSKSRVKAAGKRIRDGVFTPEDIHVLENWRASHAYVLNTFQATLRNRSRGQRITVAQRLKRRHTIFDKLRREPDMQLSTMHDIAGCRLIFQSERELIAFRTSLHSSRFRHRLLVAENDKYNYIANPKTSGYRGIHDVYEYHVNSANGPLWNGLRIEIQYRTIYQHAWATAVEVADIITVNRIKFNEADKLHAQFFKLASEIIARTFEGRASCYPDMSNRDLVTEFTDLDRRLGLIRTFSNLKRSANSSGFKTNTLLIFHTDSSNSVQWLEIETFDSINRAIARYEELERKLEGRADIVLVRAESEASVRDAFRNYFSDTNDFVKYVTKGCRSLLK